MTMAVTQSWRSVGTMLLRWWTIRTSQLFSILSSLPLALRCLAMGSGGLSACYIYFLYGVHLPVYLTVS